MANEDRLLEMLGAGKCSIIDEHAASFRNTIKNWRFRKDDPQSPLLTEAVQNLLSDGFYDTVEAICKAERMSQYKGIMRLTPGLILEQQILALPEMTGRDDAKAVTNTLLGSMIKRALAATQAIGIDTQSAGIDPEMFFTHGHKIWSRH